MKPPVVSVLVPAYRAGAFVDRALGSVVAQSFGEFEVVCVDDASPDDTCERLLAWQARDERVRVSRNSTNRGVTGNWNECLARAAGEFVIKLDADDAFQPSTLEQLVSALEAAGVVGAGVRTLVCDPELNVIGGYPSDEALRREGIDPYSDHVLPCARWYSIAAEGVQLWNGDAFMVRRSLLEEVGGLDERLGCPSDTDLLIRLLETEGRFAHVAYPGLLYRRYEGSTSDAARKAEGIFWEGTFILLASLSRQSRRRRLSRRERRQFVRCWNRWRRHAAHAAGEGKIPEERFEGLRDLFRELKPPSPMDRLLVAARDRLAAFPA